MESSSYLHSLRQSRQEGTLKSAAQNPPVEILLAILKKLLLGFSQSRDRYDIQPSDLMAIKRLGYTQSDIRSAALVCKTWNLASTETLYSTPILASSSKIRSFGRAIENSPSLGPLVKRLHVFVFERGDSDEWVGDQRGILSSTLRCCTNLEALTFIPSPRDAAKFCKWGAGFIRDTKLGEHLRELGIWEGTHDLVDILPKNASLPFLEVMVLRHVVLRSGYEFPTLPRLRTLRLSSLRPYSQTIRIQSSKFPVLRTLALHTWCNEVVIDHGCLEGLRELSLLGRYEMVVLKNMDKYPVLENLKTLELRVVYVTEDDVRITTLPPNLETFVFSLAHTFSDEARIKVLDDFRREFWKGCKNCGGLRSLVLKCRTWGDRDPTRVDPIVDTIREDCESRGIRFEAVGESFETYEDAIHKRLIIWPLNN